MNKSGAIFRGVSAASGSDRQAIEKMEPHFEGMKILFYDPVGLYPVNITDKKIKRARPIR